MFQDIRDLHALLHTQQLAYTAETMIGGGGVEGWGGLPAGSTGDTASPWAEGIASPADAVYQFPSAYGAYAAEPATMALIPAGAAGNTASPWEEGIASPADAVYHA